MQEHGGSTRVQRAAALNGRQRLPAWRRRRQLQRGLASPSCIFCVRRVPLIPETRRVLKATLCCQTVWRRGRRAFAVVIAACTL